MHTPYSSKPTIFYDNQGAVLLAANPVLHGKSKHFEVDLYFMRDKLVQQQVHVQHVLSYDQIANILTKPLSASAFLKYRSKLRVVDTTPLSLRGDIGDKVKATSDSKSTKS